MYIYVGITNDGTKTYPKHKHKFWEIMYYIEGNGYMYTEGGNISFEQGTIIVMPPGVEHGSVSESGFKNISVAGEFGHFLSYKTPITLKDTASQEGKTLAMLLYNNQYSGTGYIESLCTAYLHFIMQNVYVENNIRNAVNEIVRKINENAYDSRISIKEILRESGYAEDYIRACFKRNTGFTPNKFLTKIRIDHACALINIYGKTVPLSGIAEQCGYLDYIYFSRKFKSVTGVSPQNYLKNILE